MSEGRPTDAEWLARAPRLNADVASRNRAVARGDVRAGDRRGEYVWVLGEPLGETLWERLDYWAYAPLGRRD